MSTVLPHFPLFCVFPNKFLVTFYIYFFFFFLIFILACDKYMLKKALSLKAIQSSIGVIKEMRTTADIMDNANLQTVLKQWHNIYDIHHIFLLPADTYVFSSFSCLMCQRATTFSELCKSKLRYTRMYISCSLNRYWIIV
jgi:hypothetical protein